jgi:hypothetical protein
MRRRQAGTFVPHQVPLSRIRSERVVRHLHTLITEPRVAARRAGYDAFCQGESRASNPHAIDSPEWVSWDAGFQDGYQEAS